ncbi:Acetyltransferase (GNAT) domain-containing protein [Clostridium cavendishii DSM 21758]|uniref:Acetyltransferase (GNAT) domain-containing protein n=1 Tax=Clostridium cavendishii DSM 21758 TaxID=1121302 RepID=A0A1M6Q832_9CLOT|nr:GNAT family N-acetyltransferase [Clostridium cavendishii]SHK16444.1 Acetyltransferase (GNAT) domain-containing protein [Clostridium cavendishii DSM 21758]
MQYKIIRSDKELLQIKEEWVAIESKSEDTTYYSEFNYNLNWWNAHKNENMRLHVICILNNKKIIGIAPLIIETKKKCGIKYNILRFMGKGDFFSFIIEESNNKLSIVKEIFKIIEESDEWDKVYLSHIKEKTALANFLLRHDKYNGSFKYLMECPKFKFEQYNDFAEYKKEYKIDKEFKYYCNKLQKEIGYNFKVVNNKKINMYKSISDIHKREQEYLAKNKLRSDRSSIYSDNANDKFLEDVFKDNENVYTFFLENLDGEIIAYYSCYFYKKYIHFWNTAYDYKYEKYSPSKVNNYKVFEYIFNQEKFKDYIFDFGSGRYAWKFKWTNDFDIIYQLTLYNKTKKGSLLKKYTK